MSLWYSFAGYARTYTSSHLTPNGVTIAELGEGQGRTNSPDQYFFLTMYSSFWILSSRGTNHKIGVRVGESGEGVCVYYPLSYGVPVRERYGSTLLPATREQHDQNCTQSH